jgi:hypothetical protein
MEIDVFCITPDEELFSQVRENCASTRRWAKSVDPHDGVAVLVAGGPSLRSRIDAIKYRQELGQKIFALNGVCKLLNDNGITPDYQVLLDPQEFLTAYIGNAKEYLVASQCHPAVLSAVPDPVLWHFAAEGIEEHIPEHDDSYCMVGGGVTVALTSMCLAYSMGYRTLHCYGYDSSYENEASHAYAVPSFPAELISHMPTAGERVTVTTGGKTYVSTLCLTKQAQKFPALCDDLMDRGCTITLDCDGLLWAITQQNLIAALAA